MSHILKCHDIVKTDFVRAENCYLYDQNGRRYVDFESGIWCTALGHNHPRINQAICKQLDSVAHLGTRFPNLTAELAAVDVLEITGLMDGKCVFLSSGSEAVEFAVQTIRRVTGKELLLTLRESYLAAYGSAGKKSSQEWVLIDWQASPSADWGALLDPIPFEQIGGFVFEPGGSGSAFVNFPPLDLITQIVQRVRQAGGLIAANEITTGMGRTGKWFGFQHYNLQPDLVSLGKGLGNGYPVSAVAMLPAVADALERSGLRYAQSHQNDPLGCAVVREMIATLRDGAWVERGAELGEWFLAGLQHLAEQYPVIKAARGRGMLLGLEFQPHPHISAETVFYKLLERGYLVGFYAAGNNMRLDPALTMDSEEMERFLACMDELLASMGMGAHSI